MNRSRSSSSTQSTNENDHLLDSLTRFVKLIQQRHKASSASNTILRQKSTAIISQLSQQLSHLLHTSSTTINALHHQIYQLRQQHENQPQHSSVVANFHSNYSSTSTSPTTPSTTPSTTTSPQFHKNNSDWVPATKYMAVVKERNQIQHQLSQSLSEIQNIHAKQVIIPTKKSIPFFTPTTTTTTTTTTTPPDKNNGDWVPVNKFMAVVKERNQIQHQLSKTLSEFQNIHAKEVTMSETLLCQSLLNAKEVMNRHVIIKDLEKQTLRTSHMEQRLMKSQSNSNSMALELTSCRTMIQSQAKVLQQSHREKIQLQRRIKDNEAEMTMLKNELKYAAEKNEDITSEAQATDTHWREVVSNIEHRSKRRAGTFDRADRFLAETKINLLEREVAILTRARSRKRNIVWDEKGGV